MKRVYTKYWLLFVVVLLIQTILSYFFIRQFFIGQVKESLQFLSDRIQHDIVFDRNTWNMDMYNDDPYTPNPNGASGFNTPLYIITKEGLIIERNTPLHGLLDTSDLKRLITFQTSQTITTDTGEKWRVLSKAVVNNTKNMGVIFAAYYDPQPGQDESIDRMLTENIQKINSDLKIKNNSIDVSNIDIRRIRYSVSFEIVNSYNKVLLNNGRMPSFIDPSYVDAELGHEGFRVVTDSKSKMTFMVLSKPLIDEKKAVQGILTIAQPIQVIYNGLITYLVYSILSFPVLFIPLTILLYLLISSDMKKVQPHSALIKKHMGHFSFNRKDSAIMLGKERIKIPYSSNQYYLCAAIFSSPKKRWEQDELLEKFGEQNLAEWRKVYDSMIALNKKLGFKLITYENKTYRMNPELLPYISV